MKLVKTLAIWFLLVGCSLGQNSETAEYKSISSEIYSHGERGARIAATETDGLTSKHVESAIARLHDLVEARIRKSLEDPNRSNHSVEVVLRNLQGGESLVAAYPKRSNIPYADVNGSAGRAKAVAAFAILSGGDGIPLIRPYIQFYADSKGHWEHIEDRGSEFEGMVFNIKRLESSTAEEAWYFVWGNRVGDTGVRLNAWLYAFDGERVRDLWSREALPHGSVSFSGDQVTLKYTPDGTNRQVSESFLSRAGFGLEPISTGNGALIQ